jgi:ketosteroid isomerase-like protein
MGMRLLMLGSMMGAGLLAVGCGQGSSDALSQHVTNALEMALTLGEADDCARLFTDDAEIIPEDEPIISGRKAIEAFCNNSVAAELSFDTDRTMSLRRGDLAIEQGTYRVRNVRRGMYVENGQYMHVWRMINGEWKIYRSLFNTEVSQATQTTLSESDPTAE